MLTQSVGLLRHLEEIYSFSQFTCPPSDCWLAFEKTVFVQVEEEFHHFLPCLELNSSLWNFLFNCFTRGSSCTSIIVGHVFSNTDSASAIQWMLFSCLSLSPTPDSSSITLSPLCPSSYSFDGRLTQSTVSVSLNCPHFPLWRHQLSFWHI